MQPPRDITAPHLTALWLPNIPWNRQTESARTKAYQRRDWFNQIRPMLERGNFSQAEFEQSAADAWQRVFGHPCNGVTARALVNRIIERDRRRQDWQRAEIYLDDYAIAAKSPSGISSHSAFDHSPLADRLDFKDPFKPTLTERQNALEYSFRHFEDLLEKNPRRRLEVKRSVLNFLWQSAPDLAETEAALIRTWNRKYSLWARDGRVPSALRDRRAVPSAGAHLADLQHDLDKIVFEAFMHDGKLALAIRKLRRDGKLSRDFIERYTLDVRRNKSYVAKSVRREITARLTGLLEYRRSHWKARMAGPRIARNHNYDPGDYFAADDVTWNIIFWYLDDDGRPAVSRGECLIWFDCRSLYPLGYVLTPGKYNGETIRRGLLNIHDKHGLPHRAFIFEKGIWQSRLIEGSRPRDFLGWDEYEMGLRQRGLALEVRHAVTPQGKLIEGVFNIIQQNQRNLPGFVGFNERNYDNEKLQIVIGRVRRGLVHPAEHLLSIEQWQAALDQSLQEYMREPQNGKLLQGQSPAEMFANHRPLRKLPDDARFLLASHRLRARVKPDGLAVTIRGQRRFFYSEALGQRLGREVYAWFNIEQPDLLTVTDLENKNPLTIQRVILPAFDATPEQLGRAQQAVRGFMKPARIVADNLKHSVRNSITRDNILDAETETLGSHIRRETARFETEQAEHGRQQRRAIRLAEENGLPIPQDMRSPGRVARGIELEAAALARIEAKEKENAP